MPVHVELALQWSYDCLIKWLLRVLKLFPCFMTTFSFNTFLLNRKKENQWVMVRNTRQCECFEWFGMSLLQPGCWIEVNKRARDPMREARLSASPPVQPGSPDESSTAHTHQRRVWILHWSRCTCCFQELEKDRHWCSETVWKDENRQCVLSQKPKKVGAFWLKYLAKSSSILKMVPIIRSDSLICTSIWIFGIGLFFCLFLKYFMLTKAAFI